MYGKIPPNMKESLAVGGEMVKAFGGHRTRMMLKYIKGNI